MIEAVAASALQLSLDALSALDRDKTKAHELALDGVSAFDGDPALALVSAFVKAATFTLAAAELEWERRGGPLHRVHHTFNVAAWARAIVREAFRLGLPPWSPGAVIRCHVIASQIAESAKLFGARPAHVAGVMCATLDGLASTVAAIERDGIAGGFGIATLGAA